MLKLYCEEAKTFGDAPLPIGVPVRQITVVLNPASNDGYAVNVNFELS